MVVYSAFNHCVTYNYKTYLFSKATVILIITTFLSIMFPIIFTYRTHGFWLRSDTYQEQPNVAFKYDYVLLVDSSKMEDSLICSNLPNLLHHTKSKNHCPFMKAWEEDFNKEGLKDVLHLSINVALPEDQPVHGIYLLLFFDYMLSSHCRLQMEGMGVVTHSSALSGAGLSVVADLGLVQRKSLDPHRAHTLYNRSIVAADSAFSLPRLVHQYASRDVSVRLENVYTVWSSVRLPTEPFTLDVTLFYREVSVRYTPTFWHRIKCAWMLLFPILAVSLLVFRAVKRFIFSNQLVCTYKDVPWKKAF